MRHHPSSGDLPDGLDLGTGHRRRFRDHGAAARRATGCASCSSPPATGTPISCNCRPRPTTRRRICGACWPTQPAQAVPLCALRSRRARAGTSGSTAAPVYCTKIASELVRTYTDRHGLKDLVPRAARHRARQGRAELGLGRDELTTAQQRYAARDVLYLHALARASWTRCWRARAAPIWPQACFDFLPTRVALDLAGWPDQDVFAH